MSESSTIGERFPVNIKRSINKWRWHKLLRRCPCSRTGRKEAEWEHPSRAVLSRSGKGCEQQRHSLPPYGAAKTILNLWETTKRPWLSKEQRLEAPYYMTSVYRTVSVTTPFTHKKNSSIKRDTVTISSSNVRHKLQTRNNGEQTSPSVIHVRKTEYPNAS